MRVAVRWGRIFNLATPCAISVVVFCRAWSAGGSLQMVVVGRRSRSSPVLMASSSSTNFRLTSTAPDGPTEAW